MDDRKLDITLLCGGISAEREVSLMTGTQIAEALRTVGHRVWQSDIAPDNSVDSSLIADARVEFTGRGDINDQVERGWLNKILDFVNPF